MLICNSNDFRLTKHALFLFGTAIFIACGSAEKASPTADTAQGKDGIKKVISGHAAEIQKCYRKELKDNPELEGKVVVGWIIAKDGSVDKSWIKNSTTKSVPLEDCIIDNANSWHFAPQKEEVEVAYPFVFKLQKE